MRHHLLYLSVLVASVVLLAPLHARAISRAEVMTRAQTYAFHPWHCSSQNLTGLSCPSGYESVYTVGDTMGLPYDWGGFMTIDTFDRGIDDGYGAGSYSSDGSLSCTVGLDCSGFVSSCWDLGWHCATAGMPDVCNDDTITRADLLPGDVFNIQSYHVILYSHEQANGRPFLYESAGYNVHTTFNMGWSYVEDYTPLRYNEITGTEVGDLLGTVGNPIEIDTFPFVHTGDTTESTSDMFDFCAASWDTRETGPEVVYHLELDQPGQLVVSVWCAERLDLPEVSGVDIDVHLYEAMNELDCVARNHTDFDVDVDCGEYYVVADTWVSSGGTEYPGIYTLSVDFVPDTTSCGEPHGYEFLGLPGTPCGFEGDPDLPFCNENLGATTCLATGSTAGDDSWCSMECTSHTDCTAHIPGGCCADIGYEDNYCLIAEYCDEEPTEDTGPDTAPDTAPDAGPDTAPDAGPDTPDTSVADTQPDTGPVPDSGGPDATQDTAPSDSGSTPVTGQLITRNEGCGCGSVSGEGVRYWWGFGLLFLVIGWVRRPWRSPRQ